MKQVAVLGCDPGKTSGIALFQVVDGALVLAQQIQLPWHDACWMVQGTCVAWKDHMLIVAFERFVITTGTVRAGRSDENWSIEGIGCGRFIAREYGHKFILKGASDAKKFASDEHLRQVNWYRASSGGHINDATRIAVLAAADELGIVPPWV